MRALVSVALVALVACSTSTQSGLGGSSTTSLAGGAAASSGSTSSSTAPPDPKGCAGMLAKLMKGEATNVADLCANAQFAADQVMICQGGCAPDCPVPTGAGSDGWSAACAACMSKPTAQGGCADALATCAATACQ
jgi:hypothetical protein